MTTSRFPYPHQQFLGDSNDNIIGLLRNLSSSPLAGARVLTAVFDNANFSVVTHGLGRRLNGAIVLGQASTAYTVKHISDESTASLVNYDKVAVFEARNDNGGALLAITDSIPVLVF